MQVKFLIDEDFVNYKKCSMFLGFPYCTFKCDKENGTQLCQNMPLIHDPNIEISIEALFERYVNNPLSKAIVCGGLEPLESCEDLISMIAYFREHDCKDEFVIYTGFTEDEVKLNYPKIFNFDNLVFKFGRFKPNQQPHFDEVLGISLASDNQYGKKFNSNALN